MSAGAQHTIDSLYTDHNGWLRNWLRARLTCSQQAADFAQDTFVRILGADDASHRIASIREPRSYLATIANRVMADHFRRQALERVYLQVLAQQPEEEAPDPETRAMLLETLVEVDAMLAGLGAKVRRAFLLSQLRDMPYADIAARLSVSVSSVKKYIAKATEHCLIYALEHGL